MARFPSIRRACAALLAVPLVLTGVALTGAPAGAAGGTSTQVAGGLTRPAGVVVLGSGADRTLWVSDGTHGFCRLDAGASGGTTAACVTTLGTPAGAVYDPDSKSVYVADGDATSTGIWRLTYDPAAKTVGSPVNVVPGSAVGTKQPAYLTLGTDGALYVGYRNAAAVERVVGPSGATPALQPVGSTSAGNARGLTFVGATLFVAQTAAVTEIANASSCAACPAVAVPGLTAAAPTALSSDSAGSLYWAEGATTTQVQRFDLVTSTQAPVTSTGTPLGGGAAVPIVDAGALALDDAGTLLTADDGLGGVNQGRLWTIGTDTPLQAPFAQPAPSTPDLATGSDTGRSSTDNVTRLTAPVLTGSATPAATVQIMRGTRLVGSGVADTSGIYRVTAAGLGNGRHTLTALAVRGVRSSVRSAGITLTVDTVAPPLRVAARPRPTTYDHTPKFRWTSQRGARAACSLQLVTAAPVFVGCRSPYTSPQLGDGDHRFVTRVVDVAGNVRVSPAVDFRLRSARSLRGGPHVQERSPKPGATGVDRLADIDVRFSERVRNVSRTTVKLTDLSGRRVPVRLQYDALGAVATLDPRQTLPKDRTFLVTVKKTVTDLTGHKLPRPLTWRFTTGPRPIVSAVRPFVNSTDAPRIANVTVIFNESVRDVSTRTLRLSDTVTHKRVPVRVRIVDPDLALIDPIGRLAPHRTYVAIVTSGVRDRAGNHLVPKVWAFTTV